MSDERKEAKQDAITLSKDITKGLINGKEVSEIFQLIEDLVDYVEWHKQHLTKEK